VNKVKKEDKNKNNNKDDNKDIDNKDNNKNNVKNKGNNKENDNVKDNEKNNIIKKQESTDLEDLRESIEKERIELKKEKESFINKKKEFEKEKEKFKKEKEELEQKFNQQKIEPKNETKKKAILVGLNNIGATCYMNATLQCLSNTKKLTEYFLNEYKSNKSNILSYEYYKVLKNLWDENNHKNAYSPYSFKEVLSKENPLFSGIQANDSKDLLNFLVERFHQELNKTKPKNEENKINFNQVNQSDEMAMFNLFMAEFKLNFNSPISNLFYGLLETKSQCSNCKIIKFNFQI
jgi:ubiquitin C-terminal hydrolase